MHRLLDVAAGGRSRSIDRLANLDASDSGESATEDDDSRDGSQPPSHKKRRLAIFESEEQNEDLLPHEMVAAEVGGTAYSSIENGLIASRKLESLEYGASTWRIFTRLSAPHL